MDPQLKERLVGAAVLVVAGILFIPQLLDGPDERPPVTVGLELPAPDDGRRTHTIRLDVPAERPATKSTGNIIRSTPDAVAPTASAPEPGPPPSSAAAETSSDSAAKPKAEVQAPETVNDDAASSEPPVAPDKSAAPPPAPPAPAKAAPPAGDWAVQVGSFSSEDNAKRLQSRLKSAGFETFQARLVTDSGTMHRVRMGPVDDRPAAESLAARLGKAGYPGRVVQVGD